MGTRSLKSGLKAYVFVPIPAGSKIDNNSEAADRHDRPCVLRTRRLHGERHTRARARLLSRTHIPRVRSLKMSIMVRDSARSTRSAKFAPALASAAAAASSGIGSSNTIGDRFHPRTAIPIPHPYQVRGPAHAK